MTASQFERGTGDPWLTPAVRGMAKRRWPQIRGGRTRIVLTTRSEVVFAVEPPFGMWGAPWGQEKVKPARVQGVAPVQAMGYSERLDVLVVKLA